MTEQTAAAPAPDDPISMKLKADVQEWVAIRDRARVLKDQQEFMSADWKRYQKHQLGAIKMIHTMEKLLYVYEKGAIV